MTRQPRIPIPLDKRAWSPSLIPGPITLVSTVDSTGAPNVAPKSWVQMVAFTPPTLMFAGTRDGRTEQNVLSTRCFGLSLVDAALAPRVYECIRWRGAERIARSGFRLVPATVIPAPLVDNCPAHLECRLVDTKDVGSGLVVFGEIVAASVRADVLEPAGRARYARLAQALFLEDGLYATVDAGHPASPEPLGPETTRWVYLLSQARPELMTPELVRAHVAHLERLEAEGRLELCGPFPEHHGGMVILRHTSEPEARAIAGADPFVTSGAETYELRRLEVSCRDNRHLGVL